ncbi:hypothetical protein LLH00_02115 [bacterium]|nr:hypothetical protein [bacterium]
MYFLLTVRKRERKPQWDEYHIEVARRSRGIGGLAFVTYAGLAYCYVTFHYLGESIPFDMFQVLSSAGVVVFMGACSLTALSIYYSDCTERRTVLDRWHRLNALQKSALAGVTAIWIYPLIFWLAARESSIRGLPPEALPSAIAFSYGLLYFINLYQLRRIARASGDEKRLAGAFKASLAGMLAAVALVSIGMVWLAAGKESAWLAHLPAAFFIVIFAAELTLFLAPLLNRSGRERTRQETSSEA